MTPPRSPQTESSPAPPASADQGSSPEPHFAEQRSNPRDLPSWHRLAHVARELEAGLEALVPDLGAGPDARVLDYGSADAPYRRFFDPTVEFLAADLPGNPDADLVLQGAGTVPVADESFDVVLSTQVLEHVADPALYLAECHRVLRPGGRMLLSTHGLMIYHPDPVDLWRWTSEGLRQIVADAGFEVRRLEGIMGLGASGLQFTQDAVLARTRPRLKPAVSWLAQRAMGALDRAEPPASKRLNACVFALVAVRT